MKLNDLVAVYFYDHVQCKGISSAIHFVVCGRLVKFDDKELTVASWTYKSKRRRCDHNVTTFTIVRSTITHIDVLTPVDHTPQ